MANLQKWKRFMAVGCNHGALVDLDAVKAVLKFSRLYKPHRKFHLGDVIDYAAFRSGAPGTRDEAVSLEPDIVAGAKFIREFEPTDLLIGNHDDRVWRLSNHHNAIIAKAAMASRNEFLTACEKAHVKQVIDHYDVNKSWIVLGDTKFLHGFWQGGENALRDHAEHFGKCVIAHLHRAEGPVGGRRCEHPVCVCVGTLANIPMMEYAKTNRSTARWSHGFAWGEYSDTECHINLSVAPQGEASRWLLPL